MDETNGSRHHNGIYYAYVKFVEDGIIDTVPVSDIKKFNIEQYTNKQYNHSKTFRTKYSKDGEYYKAFVISVAETREKALQLGTEKRFRIPNIRFLDAGDTDVNSDGQENNSDVDLSSKNTKQIKKARDITNFKSLLNNNEAEEQTNEKNEERHTVTFYENKLKKKKEIIKELRDENERLKKLNTELQKSILDRFQELYSACSVNTNTEVGPNTISRTEENDLLPGLRRKENVHVGRNVWLPKHIFDNIYRKKKDTIFIKELAVAIFGENTLRNSSLCGHQKKMEPGRPPLNPTNLLAMQDLLRYRLNEKGVSKAEQEEFMKKMDRILNEKIQDLRRKPRLKKGQGMTEEQLGDKDLHVVEEYNDDAEIQPHIDEEVYVEQSNYLVGDDNFLALENNPVNNSEL